MAKRLKTITAGRLVVVGCYTIPTPRSTERERKALREISSAAQMTINANRSWQRLELLLAANFGRRDLHVVLTYDDEHLPANRQAAVQRVRKMLPQLRAVRKSRGQELKYIYVTEQLSSEGGRLHHHMVVNGTGADLDVLRSLWPYGEVELETLDTWQGYEALAKYLTKEPRELGKPEVGARNWAASIGLARLYSVWKPGVTSPRGGRKCMEKLQKRGECGKLIVKDGWLMCPSCRRRKVLQVRPDTTAKNLIVYCRDCRTETMVDIEQGQCFESQCR